MAPDKFKGTLSADEVAAAIAGGLTAGGVTEPIGVLPIADGGEGTMEALLGARGGRVLVAQAEDALGRPVEARFAVLDPGKRAVVEVAEASGLWRLDRARLDPEAASTRGTGQLIRAACAEGVSEILIAAGGSATTDGGRGALEALGARFEPEIDLAPLRRTLAGVRLTIACDVENPMLGERGAAAVFAAQKGAGPEAVARLESRLERWAALAATETGRDPSTLERAGAAGGFAGGLWAFAQAELVGGAAFVLDEVGFDRRLPSARAVVTGEGRLDSQTFEGKAVGEVARRCERAEVPAFAIVARNDAAASDVNEVRLAVIEAAPSDRTVGPLELEEAARRLAAQL